MSLPENELLAWIALWQIIGVGPVTFFSLLKKWPVLSEVFKASPAAWRAAGLEDAIMEALKSPDWALAEKTLRWAEGSKNFIIPWAAVDSYPPLLREIAAPPPLLFVRGAEKALRSLQLAIVGSRNPTPIGKENAQQLGYALSQSGLTITSGLALGIDAAAHQGALQAKAPTIAVMGTGVDRIYPARHRQLAEAILAEEGALISEFPLGTLPQAAHFPRRNRLISGLSRGVLVVEAAVASGSLITARFAVEQGREVFAIPGSIHNPLARGCHVLLRQGAKLVETVTDVLEELGSQAGFKAVLPEKSLKKKRLSKEESGILAALDDTPTAIETILKRTGLDKRLIYPLLIKLELAGHLITTLGGVTKGE